MHRKLVYCDDTMGDDGIFLFCFLFWCDVYLCHSHIHIGTGTHFKMCHTFVTQNEKDKRKTCVNEQQTYNTFVKKICLSSTLYMHTYICYSVVNNFFFGDLTCCKAICQFHHHPNRHHRHHHDRILCCKKNAMHLNH